MTDSALVAAHRLLEEAVEALRAATAAAADDDLVAVLTVSERTARALDHLTVGALATIERRDVFTARGYRSAATALGDLLGWEHAEARRRVLASENVCPRSGISGATNPPRLPATAVLFTEGRTSLRHVEAVAKALNSRAAERLAPDVWAAAEEQIAAVADEYTPTGLFTWATALVEALDQDGAEPDERPDARVNELRLARHRNRPGGSIKGRLDSAAMFDAIATVLDTIAAPRTAEDDRTSAERQAEALAEVCGFALTHAPGSVVPESGGHRPHLNVIVRLEDLEDRCRTATLDFGGVTSPPELRALACDAAVIPIVMNGAGQVLDVGRLTRTVPDGLRRAVAARDLGCAHPGCDRPGSWCEVHHIVPWAQGGPTQLDNLVMLCTVHHRLIHADSGWTVRIRDGIPEFVPPSWIDSLRTPRRKPLPHLLT